MRRRTRRVDGVHSFRGVLLAQEEGKVEKGASGLSLTLETILLWVNFVVLAIGLGYLIKKFVAPFFAERSGRIRAKSPRHQDSAGSRCPYSGSRKAPREPRARTEGPACRSRTGVNDPREAHRRQQFRGDRADSRQRPAGDHRRRENGPRRGPPADIESSMASLSTDLTALRAESHQELESLERQIGAKTTAEIARDRKHAEQEIDSAGKAARMELKRYSAQLAVNLPAERSART